MLVPQILFLTLLSAGVQVSARTVPAGREQRFFDWTRMPYSKEIYRYRRERMTEQLRRSGGGILLVPARHGASDGFTFRQLDDFLYFTGLELPDSMLVLDVDDRSATLFTPPRDARYENPSRPNDFPGRALGSDPELAEASGIAGVRPFSELSSVVEGWVAKGKRLRLNLGRPGTIPAVSSDFISGWTPSEALTFHLQTKYPKTRVENAYEDIARLRMVHGPEEIEAMRRVCALTATAVRHAAGFVRDGVDERTLEAELEAAFKRGGSQRLAFASIIKSGPNSLWPWRVLAANYDRRNRVMRDGELVVFDVGTELDYYVSDVGRTFPVSGRFTQKQKQKLAMVTSVSDAILAAIRPGVTFADLKKVALAAIPEEVMPGPFASGFGLGGITKGVVRREHHSLGGPPPGAEGNLLLVGRQRLVVSKHEDPQAVKVDGRGEQIPLSSQSPDLFGTDPVSHPENRIAELAGDFTCCRLLLLDELQIAVEVERKERGQEERTPVDEGLVFAVHEVPHGALGLLGTVRLGEFLLEALQVELVAIDVGADLDRHPLTLGCLVGDQSNSVGIAVKGHEGSGELFAMSERDTLGIHVHPLSGEEIAEAMHDASERLFPPWQPWICRFGQRPYFPGTPPSSRSRPTG